MHLRKMKEQKKIPLFGSSLASIIGIPLGLFINPCTTNEIPEDVVKTTNKCMYKKRKNQNCTFCSTSACVGNPFKKAKNLKMKGTNSVRNINVTNGNTVVANSLAISERNKYRKRGCM